jgi:hypothetical protein
VCSSESLSIEQTGGDAHFAHLGAVHVSLRALKRHAALDFPSLSWGYIPGTRSRGWPFEPGHANNSANLPAPPLEPEIQ